MKASSVIEVSSRGYSAATTGNKSHSAGKAAQAFKSEFAAADFTIRSTLRAGEAALINIDLFARETRLVSMEIMHYYRCFMQFSWIAICYPFMARPVVMVAAALALICLSAVR